MNKMTAFLVLCGVGGLAIFSSTISKNPVLPILAQQIGATQAAIGLIAAASTLTGILASLPAGLLSDRIGRKPVMIASGLVFLTAPLLYFFIQTPWQLALVRVYHGLATAVFGPVAMAYVADLTPTRRGERLGYYSSITLAGRALAPVVGGSILAFSIWQNIYWVCAAAALLAFIAMFLLPDSRPQPKTAAIENAPPSKQLVMILKNRTILVTSIAEAAQYFAFGALEAFLPLYALSVGVDKAAVGLLFGVQVGVRTLARPLMGWLSDKRGRKMPILVGLALTAFSTALFAVTASWVIMLVLSVVFGLGLSIASAATSAYVADLAPESGRGTALGLMSTIMDVGQALGPVVLGALLMVISYRTGFAITGGLVLLACIIFALLAREGRPNQIQEA